MKFVDPPASTGGGTVHPKYMTPETVAAIKARPGEWALAFEQVTPSVRSAVSQWAKRHPGFEATSRGSNTMDVYVRYVGDPS